MQLAHVGVVTAKRNRGSERNRDDPCILAGKKEDNKVRRGFRDESDAITAL